MYDLTGTIKDFSIDYQTGNPKVIIELNEKPDAIAMYEEFKGTETMSINFDKRKWMRSSSSNAYFWVLCGKLAAKTKQRKIDIYKEFIRNIGNNFDVYSIRDDAVDEFVNKWGGGHLGWVCDILGKSDKEGYTDVVAYYGSSVYDASQMNTLIENAIAECIEQDIPIDYPGKV